MTQPPPFPTRESQSANAPFATFLLAAGLLGTAGVALGAFGAHGLRALLAERGTTHAWATAVQYHLLHTVALVGLAACLKQPAGSGRGLFQWAGRCWIAGTVIFSGSLYVIALGGPRWLGPVTPLGGVALIAGWVLIVVAALKKNARQ